jgi:hypothetical protein
MVDSQPKASFGPVELDVIALDEPRPSPALLRALARQVEAGTVRLLDFVVVTKSESGVVEATEIDLEEFGLESLTLLVPGLSSDEDVQTLAEQLPLGGAAAIVALELVWARELAEQLAASDSAVIATERIPAAVVNAIVESAEDQ